MNDRCKIDKFELLADILSMSTLKDISISISNSISISISISLFDI